MVIPPTRAPATAMTRQHNAGSRGMCGRRPLVQFRAGGSSIIGQFIRPTLATSTFAPAPRSPFTYHRTRMAHSSSMMPRPGPPARPQLDQKHHDTGCPFQFYKVSTSATPHRPASSSRSSFLLPPPSGRSYWLQDTAWPGYPTLTLLLATVSVRLPAPNVDAHFASSC